MHDIESILFEEPQGVLSLTGAGGKTSLMFNFAQVLVRAGKRVLTTTTTKIFFPTPEQCGTVLVDPDPEEILRRASCIRGSSCCITAGASHQSDSGKLVGFTPEAIGRFAHSALFDWILVEADGSARRPLKAQAPHEPVIPAATTVLVGVAGLEVLGEPLSEDLVFRSAIAGEVMGLGPGEIITKTALARLIAHRLGLYREARLGMRRYIFLNKADNVERQERAAGIAEELGKFVPPVADALIVGQALDGVRVHALYPLGFIW